MALINFKVAVVVADAAVDVISKMLTVLHVCEFIYDQERVIACVLIFVFALAFWHSSLSIPVSHHH